MVQQVRSRSLSFCAMVSSISTPARASAPPPTGPFTKSSTVGNRAASHIENPLSSAYFRRSDQNGSPYSEDGRNHNLFVIWSRICEHLGGRHIRLTSSLHALSRKIGEGRRDPLNFDQVCTAPADLDRALSRVKHQTTQASMPLLPHPSPAYFVPGWLNAHCRRALDVDYPHQ